MYVYNGSRLGKSVRFVSITSEHIGISIYQILEQNRGEAFFALIHSVVNKNNTHYQIYWRIYKFNFFQFTSTLMDISITFGQKPMLQF